VSIAYGAEGGTRPPEPRAFSHSACAAGLGADALRKVALFLLTVGAPRPFESPWTAMVVG